MSYIEDIKFAILRLDSASYQKLCDEFLNECGYSNIVGLGSEPGVNKTTSGTPDTYCCTDANGNYIFIEYTTQQASIYSKIESDIAKCLDEAFTHIKYDKISEIWYFHTTSNLTPEQDAKLKRRCEAKGILLKIYGIDCFANELYNKHKYLVKQHLGVAIATEQILSYEDFIRTYNQARTAAPIDTEFKFRNEEINSVISALQDNKAVLLCGVAGVGKTRLALECCRRYAERNKYQIFCIRNNNQQIYDDLHLFFSKSGNYVVLIDDANELTHLETILNYFNEHSDSNFKIILSVRNYAAKEISITIKPLMDLAILKILPLKDEEIKELLKDNYGIINPLFLERIIKVAEGNARIALLAGKTAVESDSLESIKDVASIYDSYYGQHLSKLRIPDNLLLVAGIAAFVGAIHLDHLDALNDIISLCCMNSDRFKESLYEIHNTEIINIYKDTAVKFADQCLSNYLLYYVFIEKKLVRLSDIIRYTFKTNKSQTINSINVLTQLYSTVDSQEYLMSELRDLWARLAKEEPNYFWEYVKVFYLVEPTQSLLLIKDRIENTDQITTSSIDDLTVDERNNTVSDDILSVLGGFANRQELDIALDLYFLYYRKRPDLLQQFYSVALNCFGIGYDDYLYDCHTLKCYIQKLILSSRNWQDASICRLFVFIAKYFLQFSFHSMGSRGRSGVSLYIIQLRSSNGTTEYRKLLWQSLIEMYSRNIETQMIEEILYNYGNGSSQDSAEVMKNDYPFILTLLKLYKEPESYYFCSNIDSLNRVFKFMGIPQDDEFDFFFESESFKLYKTFERTDERGLTYFDKEEAHKKEVEQYVSSLNKEEFIAVIDFFCFSTITLNYSTSVLINYAYEYIFKNKDYYLDALNHYFKSPYRQTPLHPHNLIAIMYEKNTVEEIWSILSSAPDNMRNTWQFYFFAIMPDKYIDNSHIQKWYDYLKDDSDKFLTSSGYRELLFISKFQKVDRDIIRKSMQIILSKQTYSIAAVELYTSLLMNSLTENIDVTIEFFKDNYDLLCELYILIVTKKRQEDYHGDLLKAIYEKQPLIVEMLFEQWNTREKYLSHDDTMKLSKLFEVDDFEAIFDHIMDIVSSSDKAYLYQEDELSSMIAIANIAEQYRDRPDTWIKHYIAVNAEDDRKMYLISCAILGLSEIKRIEYLTLFLSRNPKIDSFKNWQLLTMSMSWSGSELPLIQKRIDYLVRILPLLGGLKFLEHKKYIEDRISDLKQYMANVEIEEILRGID